jgi:Chaperone of endosialidase
MNRLAHLALTVGLCLIGVIGTCGQVQKPARVREGDEAVTVPRHAEPSSSATSMTVAAGPQAMVPRLMKISGVLHDAAGKPLTGTVDVTFSLYSTEAGGDALWFETQSVQADELGRYTVLLGAMHAQGLPIKLFTSSEAQWLGIQVGSEPEQQPRVLLVSVPYALKAGDAETLGGKPASAYVLSDSQNASTSTGAAMPAANSTQTGGNVKNQTKGRTANTSPLTPVCAALTSNAGGGGHFVPVFDGTCDVQISNMTELSNRVGIGTTSPAYELDVVGGSARVTNPSGTTQLVVSGNATSGRLGQDAAGFFFSSDTNGGAIRFATNNGALHEWMRITPAGNVGIGTTNPGAPLHVLSPVATTVIADNTSTGEILSARHNGTEVMSVNYQGFLNTSADITSAENLIGGLGVYADTSGSNNGALFPGLNLGNGGEGIASKRTAGGNQYGIDFYTGYSNRMEITNGGFVGIHTGSIAPFTSLDVEGESSIAAMPLLTLMNAAGSGAGGSIDLDAWGMNALPPPEINGGCTLGTTCAEPEARIQWNDDYNNSSDIAFLTKKPGAIGNGLIEQARISDYGSLIVDASHNNLSQLSDSSAAGTALIFGGPGSGEGIASCRGVTEQDCPNGPGGPGYYTGNQYGLDFYTGHTIQMSIYGEVNGNGGLIAMAGCTEWVNGDHQGNCPSDERLKTNIRPLGPVLDKLMRLRPVQYDFRVAEYPQYHLSALRTTGLIAQEVEKVFPDMVSTDHRGFKMLSSCPLSFLLLEGVRELKTRNDTLRRQLGRQKTQLRQAHEQSRFEQAEIRKLAGQVRELKQEQTEIAALKARLDRLETRGAAVLRAQAPGAAMDKKQGKTQVASARF